jgi:ribosomal protein S18 acetylase RimI-like enzyme
MALGPLPKRASFSEAYRLEVHYAGTPVTLQNDAVPHLDACSILSHCFPTGMFASGPEDKSLGHCHSSLNGLLRVFDSGFLYERRGKGQLVGFITSALSSGVRNNRPFSTVSIYNVCVHPEARGQGLSRHLLDAYTREIVAKRMPGTERPPGHRLYLGLDVDFATTDAVTAFSVYAKAGFVRWWEPCKSIADFDFWKLESQRRIARAANDDPRTATHRAPFPLADYWIDRERTLKAAIDDALRLPKPRVYTHFCMVRQMAFPEEPQDDNDDFASVGRAIESHVHVAIAERRGHRRGQQ